MFRRFLCVKPAAISYAATTRVSSACINNKNSNTFFPTPTLTTATASYTVSELATKLEDLQREFAFGKSSQLSPVNSMHFDNAALQAVLHSFVHGHATHAPTGAASIEKWVEDLSQLDAKTKSFSSNC